MKNSSNITQRSTSIVAAPPSPIVGRVPMFMTMGCTSQSACGRPCLPPFRRSSFANLWVSTCAVLFCGWFAGLKTNRAAGVGAAVLVTFAHVQPGPHVRRDSWRWFQGLCFSRCESESSSQQSCMLLLHFCGSGLAGCRRAQDFQPASQHLSTTLP